MKMKAIFCLIMMLAIIYPVSALVISFGSTYNYSEVVLPNNSYVHQGENISQGYFYDLNGVYGFSGKVARWKNSYDAGFGTPDNIVTLNGASHHMTFIDPAVFPTGQWYQFDATTCNPDKEWCDSGFGHGNNYVFAVVPAAEAAPAVQNNPVIVHSNITVSYENTSVEIPVIAVQTIAAVPASTQDIKATNITTIVIPTTVTPVPTPATAIAWTTIPPAKSRTPH